MYTGSQLSRLSSQSWSEGAAAHPTEHETEVDEGESEKGDERAREDSGEEMFAGEARGVKGAEGERRSEGAAPLGGFAEGIGRGRNGKALWIHEKIVNQRPLGPVRAID